jgi:ATP-dependent metalloprotease
MKVIQTGNTFTLTKASPTVLEDIPAGTFSLEQDMKGEFFLTEIVVGGDKAVELPTGSYKKVVDYVNTFIHNKEAYRKANYSHTDNILLAGEPGTGKTVIVTRTIKEFVANNGVALINPDTETLIELYKRHPDFAKDRLVLVVIEEFDEDCRTIPSIDSAGRAYFKSGNKNTLSLLDGEYKKDGMMILATTNYVNSLSSRVIRSGRFGMVEVTAVPDAASRQAFIGAKFSSFSEKEKADLTKNTNGFTIDEISAVAKQLLIHKSSIQEVVNDLQKRKKLC